MNIKEIKSKKLYKEYSIEIPYEEVDIKINDKIKDLIPSVSIPGFRKGKAPLNIVRKKYENNVLNEVLQKVLSSKTDKLIKDKQFQLFREPKIDLKEFEKNKPIKVDLKIDLQPIIKLKDFKKLELNSYEINLDKKIIDEQYKKFLSSQKKFKKININREPKKSDRLLINIDSNHEGLPEYIKTQKNLPIETDSNQEILPDLSKKLVAKKIKIGDKINLSFNLSKLLKDEKFDKVEYLIELVSIEEKVKFEITKEYLESNGFKNESELKDFLKNNINKQYEQGIKQIEKKQLMDLLDKEYNFDLPEGILDDDFNEIWQRLDQAKKDGNLDEDDKSLRDDQLKKRYKKISERRVKLGVLLQHIAKEYKISITEDEIKAGLIKYSSQYPGQ